jgi:hypothetical protein
MTETMLSVFCSGHFIQETETGNRDGREEIAPGSETPERKIPAAQKKNGL